MGYLKTEKWFFVLIVIDIFIALTAFFAAWYWYSASSPPIELLNHWDSDKLYSEFNTSMKDSSELNSKAAFLSGCSAALMCLKSICEVLRRTHNHLNKSVSQK